MDGHLTRSVPNRFSHYANPGSASHTLASFSAVPCPACISVDEQTVSIPLSHLPPYLALLLYPPSLSTSTRAVSVRVFFPTSVRRPCATADTSIPSRRNRDFNVLSNNRRDVQRLQIGRLTTVDHRFALLQMEHVVARDVQFSIGR